MCLGGGACIVARMDVPICAQCILIPPTTLPQVRVELLMRLAADGAADSRIQSLAAGLAAMLAERLGRTPTPAELVQWFADAVHLLMDYQPDPGGEEVFQTVQWSVGGGCGRHVSPITGATKGCGDCEDLAGLLVSFCMCAGIKARVVWMEQPGSPLNHVSAQVCLDPSLPDYWQWIDATLPGARLGEFPYDALARLGPDYHSRIFGLEDATAFASAGIPHRPTARRTPTTGYGTPRNTGIEGATDIPGLPGGRTDRLTPDQRQNIVTGADYGSPAAPIGAPPGGSRSTPPPVIGGNDPAIDPTAPPPAPLPLRIVVANMPPYGKIAIDDVPLPDTSGGRWDGTAWSLPLPGEYVGKLVTVSVSLRGAGTRSQRLQITADGDQPIDFATMQPVPGSTPAAAFRIVVANMPQRGDVSVQGQVLPATVDGRWDGTAWSLPLPASLAGQSADVIVSGYGPGSEARHQMVTFTASGNQSIDYATMQPVAEPTPTTTLAVLGVPATGGAPGAIGTGAGWIVEARAYHDYTAPRIPLEKQTDGTTYLATVVPGDYTISAYRWTDQHQTTDYREARLLVVPGPNTLPFSGLTAPVVVDNSAPPGEAASLRITGVAPGWTATFTGDVMPGDGAKQCTSPDACSVSVPAGGGVVRVMLARPGVPAGASPSVATSRLIRFPAGGGEYDVAFEIRRAETFAAGRDGLTSCDAAGLRCGYLSDVSLHANDQSPFLTGDRARRTFKEFERIAPVDSSGRSVFVIFVPGAGMVAIRATDAQADRLARDVALLSSGHVNAHGYLPFEFDAKALPAFGAGA